MKKFIAVFLLIGLFGCASLEKPNPGSLNDRLVYVTALSTTVAQSAGDMFIRKEIDYGTAVKIGDTLNQVNLILQSAQKAKSSGDTATALTYLNQANQILIDVEKQLQEKHNGG